MIPIMDIDFSEDSLWQIHLFGIQSLTFASSIMIIDLTAAHIPSMCLI